MCGTTTMTQLLPVFLGLVSLASGAGLAPVSVHVEGQGRPLQGESYSLVCVVSPAQAAHTRPAFVWYRDDHLLDNQTVRELSFSPLSKRDEGDYQCGLNLSEVQYSHSVSLHVMVLEKISLVPEVEVEEGQTVILNCSVHSDPTAFLTWRLGGKTLYTVRSNSDSLVLHNASQYHLQVVECEAYNNGLVQGFLDAYSLIRIKGTYEVVATPWLHANVVPVLHRPFRMECLVMELPNQGVNVHLTYTWYKDDKLIEGQSDSVLKFATLSKEDQGVYTCTARNGKPLTTSLDSNTLDVLVLLPPVIHIEPNTTDNVIKRASGETLTLTCEVTEALPWVNEGGYRWSYLPSPGGHLRPLEGRESTLTLGPLTREDSGQYICQAWNDALFEGLIPPGNASVTVVVMLPPVVYIEPKTTDVITRASGETLTLTCEVTEALPWINEGGYRWSYLPSPGGHLRPLEGRESTLTLGPLTREDSGQYICQAWNDALFEGLIPPGNASVTVDVTYLENISLTSDLEVNEGDHVTLTCSVDSNPAARLSWLVEGREVRHVTANVDHYVVERAACSDNKTYTCRASIPHLPGLEITRNLYILVNCKEKSTGSQHSPNPNVTSVLVEEAPQADVSSSSLALTVGLAISMSILAVVVIVVVVFFVRHTRRNCKSPSSAEQYKNCPTVDV